MVCQGQFSPSEEWHEPSSHWSLPCSGRPLTLSPLSPPSLPVQLEAILFTSFISQWCQQPLLLKMSVFVINQSPCQALAPSFCISLSSRGKNLLWASFYTNLPDVLGFHNSRSHQLGFCSTSKSHERYQDRMLSSVGMLLPVLVSYQLAV